PQSISELSEEYDRSIYEFACKAKKSFGFLKALCNKKEQYNYCEELVRDMLANARRKGEMGLYTDAILRLYRSVELWTQWKLGSDHKIDTSNVKEEDIPQYLIKEFACYKRNNKYKFYKLPLLASIKLLAEKRNKQAKKIINEMKDDLNDLMRARNYCSLEHNMEPRSKKDYDRLFDKVLKMIDFEEVELRIFPKF
ncbi:hypothetical protein DRQ33_08740, partial [bacterium]